MARIARCVGCPPLSRAPLASLSAFVALLITPNLATAQTQLVPLHVRNFTLGVDRANVRVGETFHVIVKTHVDEVLTQLDQTTLPSLYGFQSEGDERECIGATKGGTDCTETLSLIPTLAGDRTIGPVTLDAIDANTGRPSRFGTNVVTVHISPDPLAGVTPIMGSVVDVLTNVVRIVVLLLAIVLIIVAFRWLFARTRRPASDMFEKPLARPAVNPNAAPPPSIEHATFEARYRAALQRLRDEPTRRSVLELRALVRERCHAGERETLGDLIARDAMRGDAALAAALRAIDRAAFVEESRLGEAIVEAYPALERLTGAPA